ncbi:MAG TPA: Type 1 glutamine amidotransferase-like domain-containing protein [Candidatus Paceibacterota bacterium]
MKLFLASANNSLSLIAKRLPKKGKGVKVLFIANASDNYSGDRWWIEADRNAFKKIGCEIIEVDLRKTNEKGFVNLLKTAQVIHFCGGSVLYLTSLIRERKLEKSLIKNVKQGKIVYSGTSAGSMITSSDLRLSSYDDEDKEYAEKMKDFSGLGLVNFLIIPHTNNKDFVKSNIQMVEHLSENLQPLIFINDNQVVWVENDNFSILSV